ncbi:hypothetical protein [Alcaligenes faecalis]|uniref:hypothetical protein n=1 Tax=Alcaligenes faecalis TaxID=511 RepID=UPI0024BC46D9|nr:hypothetical protein [Alcaligenes faecalis]
MRTDAEPGKHAVDGLSGGRATVMLSEMAAVVFAAFAMVLSARALMASSDSSLSGRLAQLRQRIEQACLQAGRPADAVALYR